MSEPHTIPRVLAELPDLLRTDRFGRKLRWHSSIGSTNAQAMTWARDGVPEGALVGADHQTAGRGRHGRAWSDAPGLNLLFSLVLRPTLPQDRLGLIPLAAGLAVAEAIENHTPLSPSLKWPNDILVDGKKVCGILLEGRLTRSNDSLATMVLGIGFNINQTELPADLADKATSLALETGQLVQRVPLLADLLVALEKHYDSLSTDLGVAVLAGFERRMAGLGHTATVAFPLSGESVEGTILGIAENGALRLATSEGERLFHSGEVSLQNSVRQVD